MSQPYATLVRFCADVLAGRELQRWAMEAIDPQALLAVAEQEGVTVLLAGGLSNDSRFEVLHSTLRSTVRICAMKELARLAQARRVISQILQVERQLLVLKGSALAYWLYALPEQRSRCDLDLLVPGMQSAECVVDALAELDFDLVANIRPVDAHEFEVALLARNVIGHSHAIDLHWRVSNNAAIADRLDFEELWEASIPVPELHPDARGLGRVHALIHALLHRITAFPGGRQNRLIWLYDIHLLAGGCDASQWQEVLQMCRDRKIATPCLDGLRASREFFGTAIPQDVETQLHALMPGETWQLGNTLGQGGMDRAHLGALPWPKKLRWLWRKLVPSVEFMRYRYHAVGVVGLAKAYVARWWLGMKRAVGGR